MRYGATRWLRNLTVALIVFTNPAWAEKTTIAALGDSLTAGYGLSPEDGFVPSLQRWLDAQGAEITMINAGVSGDTTAGGAARVDWTLTDEVDAMIVALGANDYLRGLDPQLAKSNLAKILDAAAAKGVKVLLVGLDVGSNYGPDYKAEFDAIYADLAAEYAVDFYPNWFAGVLEVSGSQTAMADYQQEDRLHLNADGVRLTVDAIGPAVLDLVD